MKNSSIPSIALVVSSLAFGCANVDDGAPSEAPELQKQQAELTLTECGAQRDACFDKNPLFGFFTCPTQYTQCTATASNGIPAEVGSAIADAAECTQTAVNCVADARSLEETAACAEDEAQCVAAIIDVELPDVVEGTAACVDSSVSCIQGARRLSDLANCAASLTGCAVEQVAAVIPPEVGEVVEGVSACRVELENCITSATSATALTACSEKSAVCVAATLDVTLPDVPVSDVVECAETASDCAFGASTIREVTSCATGLTSCAADVVGGIDVPEQLTCEQKWTACVAGNPFNFFKCGGELSGCQD